MKKIFGAILALSAIGAVNAQTHNYDSQGVIYSNSGNVGINRTDPSARLDIYQDQNNKWTAIFKNGAGSGDGILIKNAAATNNPSLLIQDNYGKDRFKVLSNGLVGVGVTQPTELFQVGGNTSLLDGNLYLNNATANEADSGMIMWNEHATNSPNTSGAFMAFDGNANKLTIATKTESATYEHISMVRNGNLTLQKFGGKIGVGHESPEDLLDIRGNNAIVRIKSNDANNNATLKLQWGTNAGHNISYHPNSAITYFDSKYVATNGQTYGDVQFRRNVAGTMESTFMIKAENGNVGIGKNHIAPTAKLHIKDAGTSGVYSLQINDKVKFRGDGVVNWGASANYGVLSWDGNKTIIGAVASKNLSLHSGGSEKVFVSTTGDVGIGNNAPQEKLHVSGASSIHADLGEISGSHWETGKHTLELQSNDAGDVALSFHRAGHTSSSIFSPKSLNGGLVFSGDGKTTGKHMYINSVGQIGAGTTTPQGDFHIGDVTNAGIVLENRLGPLSQKTAAQIGWAESTLTGNAGDLILTPRTDIDASIIFYNKQASSVTERMRINKDGNIGIGTNTPNAKLDVNGEVRIQGTANSNNEVYATMKFFNNSPNTNAVLGQIQAIRGDDSWQKGELSFQVKDGTNIKEAVRIKPDGSIGIGTTNTRDNKLAVNGMIRAKEVKVEGGNWPDYVFTSEYNLPTLKEVEAHIKENGHLANIPSAKEVAANGIQLGEMNRALLEKIEELTLYTIEQEKNINELKEENKLLKDLNTKLIELQSRIDALENK